MQDGNSPIITDGPMNLNGNAPTTPTDAQDFILPEVQALPEMILPTYIKTVMPLGQALESQYGIPKMIPIIQSAHESRCGNSGLARKYGNLFGIVATEHWKSQNKPVAAMQTWEHIGGRDINTVREFRSYKSWRESFYDWAWIITSLSVYKTAYALMKEGNVVDAIKSMAPIYATDPNYATVLISLYREVAS